MKRNISLVLCAVLMLLCISGCSQSSGVGVKEEHVHSFSEADCASPSICECGETQGDAKGHSFGSWSLAGGNMSRVCESCGEAETVAADFDQLLAQELPGAWDYEGVMHSGGFDSVYDVFFENVSLKFEADGTVRSLGTKSAGQGSWKFTKYVDDADLGDTVYFDVGFTVGKSESSEVGLVFSEEGPRIFYHEYTDGVESTVFLSKEADRLFGAALASDWSAQLDGEVYTLELKEDRSFVLWVNGETSPYRGIWKLCPVIKDNVDRHSSELILEWYGEYTTFGEVSCFTIYNDAEQLRDNLTVNATVAYEESGSTIRQLYNMFHSRELLDRVMTAVYSGLSGEWTSTQVSHDETVMTDEYKILFTEEESPVTAGTEGAQMKGGRFSSMLHKEFNGVWVPGEISRIWGDVYEVEYLLYADGSRNGYPLRCRMTISEPVDNFELTMYDGYGYTFVSSAEKAAEIVAEYQSYQTMIVGDWVVTDARIDCNNDTLLSNPQGLSVSFLDDGSFSGTLFDEADGSWEFSGMATDVNGAANICEFRLTFTGNEMSHYIVQIQDGVLKMNHSKDDDGDGIEDRYGIFDMRKAEDEVLQSFDEHFLRIQGSYKLEEASVYDSGAGTLVPYELGGGSLIINEDNSFSGNIAGEEIRGTWACTGLYEYLFSYEGSRNYSTVQMDDAGKLYFGRQIDGEYMEIIFVK